MPSPVGVLAPLLLAGVLLLSAWAKWREPASTLSAIRLLRLPSPLQARWVARALPVGEGVLALAMLSPWSPLTRVASVAGLLLFVGYAAIVARALTFDPRPSCGCFGRIGDQRIVPRTLVRNLLFVLAAVVFVWFAFSGHTVPGVLMGFGAAEWAWLLGAALVAVIALLVAGPSGASAPAPAHPAPGHAEHTHEPLNVVESDDPEDYLRGPIPDGVLIAPDSTPATLRELATHRAQLLVFANCYCGSTASALLAAQSYRDRLPAIDIRCVFSGVPVMPSTDLVSTEDAWRDHGSLVWKALSLTASPSAVLLGADGLLAGGPVSGLTEVEAFLVDVEDALSVAP